jgi:hypothetical protein
VTGENKLKSSFSGRWFTTFGTMELTQDGLRVNGIYEFQAQRCTIDGTIRDGHLHFTYQEPTAAGEGWFELSRHGRFVGEWRPHGTEKWSAWTGHREFDGIWETSFGLLKLVQEPERVFGYYEGQGPSTIEGRIENTRLTFRYHERRAQGEGYFERAPDAASFRGEWRADGVPQWAPWQGRRLLAASGVCWLVVIEAHWQHSYHDREYAFGHMLREFFTRLPHVNVRQRFFEDEAGLRRWSRELMYLAEPTAVVLASHGTQEGLTVQGKTLDTREIVESLRYADNVMLLHLSSCLMMQDGQANSLARELSQTVRFPVSGYDRSVDWAGSALIEFHFLDMVLGRGLSPKEAGRQVLDLIAYAGEQDPPGSPYPAAGFRMLMPAVP